MQAGDRNHVAGACRYPPEDPGIRRRILCRTIYTAGDHIPGRDYKDRALALV